MSQITRSPLVNNSPVVSCPTCESDVKWCAESKYRPFCCERCKLIDLGAWADEKYSVASEAASPLDDFSGSESGFNS